MGDLFTAQVWRGQQKVLEKTGLNIDAARTIAKAGMAAGDTGRVMDEDRRADYWEVYDPKRGVRTGTFGNTTIVRVPVEQRGNG